MIKRLMFGIFLIVSIFYAFLGGLFINGGLQTQPTDKCISSFTKKTIEDPEWAGKYWGLVSEELYTRMERDGIKR